METSLPRLLVGLSVQISRSDGERDGFKDNVWRDASTQLCCCVANKVFVTPGRVHLATVKSVDTVKSTVMVEWQERNICRGKEVSQSISAENTNVIMLTNHLLSANIIKVQ